MRDTFRVLADSSHKILDWPGVLQRAEAWRALSSVVVWTNGCFDMLHVGHLRSLETARSLGDLLVVGINSDIAVTRLKGQGRPICPLSDRMALVAALACVDFVVPLDVDNASGAIDALRPQIVCKGDEYSPGRRTLAERDVVERYGGRIVLVPMVSDRSTTEILARARRPSLSR